MPGTRTVAEAVRDALAGPCAVADGTPLVAACSGGADSVSLVAGLAHVAKRWPLRSVVFVDHGLRDVAAERDCARRAALRAGAPFVTATVTLETGGNLQEQARRARYATLLAHAGEDALVATGHTLDDQAETVLQRILRGSGLRGLAAMAWREGRLVRPLLAVPREETRATGFPFADDPSNASGRFQRNRLRRDVMPALLAEAPRAREALAEVASQVRVELELLDALASAVDLAAADLRGVPADLTETLLRWRHRREVGGAPPGRGAAAQLARQLVDGATDGGTSLGGGVLGRARSGRLDFQVERDPRLEVVAHGPGHYRLGTLRLELIETSTPTGREVPASQPTVARFAAEGLRWPLKIRKTSAASRTNPARRAVQRDGPEPPAADALSRGAPTTEYMITDAIGARLWPRAVGDAPAAARGPVMVLVVEGEGRGS